MRKILIGMFAMLFIILIIASTALAYLFINKNNESVSLNNDKQQLNDQLSKLQTQLDKINTNNSSSSSVAVSLPAIPAPFLIFQDDGTVAYVKYPSDWIGKLNIKLSDEVANPFKQIQSYQYILTKGNAVLTFNIVVSGQGGFPNPLTNDKFDYKDLGSKVIRYSEKGKNQWKYATKVDNSICKASPGGSSTLVDICVQDFFPGFTKKYPARAGLVASDTDLINQADQIILTTIIL